MKLLKSKSVRQQTITVIILVCLNSDQLRVPSLRFGSSLTSRRRYHTAYSPVQKFRLWANWEYLYNNISV